MTQVAEMLQVSVDNYYDVINKPNYLGLTERYVGNLSICNCSAVPELVRVPTVWKQVYNRRTDPKVLRSNYYSCAFFWFAESKLLSSIVFVGLNSNSQMVVLLVPDYFCTW